MKKKVVIVAGVIAQYPFAGMTWHYLNYILGLRALGYEVFYVEDAYRSIPHYFARYSRFNGIKYIRSVFGEWGLQRKWTVLNLNNQRFGIPELEWQAICRKATAFVNVSGVIRIRGALRKVPIRIFIDTDPPIHQIALAKRSRQVIRHLRAHNRQSTRKSYHPSVTWSYGSC